MRKRQKMSKDDVDDKLTKKDDDELEQVNKGCGSKSVYFQRMASN